MELIRYVEMQKLKGERISQLPQNPDNKDLTFEFDPSCVKKYNVQEARTWYDGASEKLKAFYTQSNLSTFIKEPIYLEAKKQYFYSQASLFEKIKLVHSGLPYNMIYTITNVVGLSKITYMDNNLQTNDEKSAANILLRSILKFNEYDNIKLNIQEPYTLVEGWGAYKIDIDPRVSKKYPVLRYFHAEDVDFIMSSGHIIGYIFKTYYKVKDKNYVLIETRTKDDNGKLVVEYMLLEKDGNVSTEYREVPLNTIPELEPLTSNIQYLDTDKFLAVPTIYFKDNENVGIYGRSFFQGSIDIFDQIDLMLSMRHYCGTKSAPIEYIPDDMCDHEEKTGKAILPSSFNRTYIPKPASKSADGLGNNDIQVTQPQIQFSEFDNETKSLYTLALVGKMSPASIGIDLTKRDNAEAQREKEKTTLLTRNSIIKQQEIIDKEVCDALLNMYFLMNKEQEFVRDYTENISVEFNEFANPSYEEEMRLLSPLLRKRVISPERFMDIVYRNKLSREDYDRELNYIMKWLDAPTKVEDGEEIVDTTPLENTNHLNATKNDIFESESFESIVK